MPSSATDNYSAAKLEPAYDPGSAVTNAYKFASGDYVAGQVLGFVAATGAVGAYANGNSDGTQTAAVICMYDCTSDGTHVSITSSGDVLAGETATDAPVYEKGFFNCAELTGLDANAITDMHARLMGANTVSGVLALF